MKDFAIKKQADKNQLDGLTDGLVNAMKYSDSNVEYPSFDSIRSDDGVMPEWFYAVFNGINDFSELTAIHTYILQDAMFEEIGELMLGIAMTEMKHYDKLSSFIKKIGGRIDQKYNNSFVKAGSSIKEALDIAISSEEKAINSYNTLISRISKLEETTTTKITLQFLAKLIADEKLHVVLLKECKGKQNKNDETIED